MKNYTLEQLNNMSTNDLKAILFDIDQEVKVLGSNYQAIAELLANKLKKELESKEVIN